jgi:hypothetical protein
MDAWLLFFGVWMSDGWTEEHGVWKGREGGWGGDVIIEPTYTVSVCTDNLDNDSSARLYDAIKMMGCSVSHVATTNLFTVCNMQLHSYLAPLSVGACKKRLPSWTWELDAGQCQQLVESMQLFNRSTTMVVLSEGLADDFQRLCLHAGYAAIIHKVVPELMSFGSNTSWHIDICNEDVFDELLHAAAAVESVYEYERPVYCLQVPSEVFYVRRNGKACWTGNSRAANGPVVLLTRQPAEGRARDGGLRLGEMEVECHLAHGISSFLKERFMECSDNYRVFVCKKCGMMANVNPENNIYSCKPCNNTTNFARVDVPYSLKLLFQEIQTMSIGSRFIT